MRPEAKLEDYFINKCKENHILQYKLTAGETGIPDRLIICGFTAFVELKAKNGKLSERQKLIIKRIRNHGGIVFVPFNKSDIDEIINKILKYNEKQD